jgi:hypothetical protein
MESQVRWQGGVGRERRNALEDENRRLKKRWLSRCWTTRRSRTFWEKRLKPAVRRLAVARVVKLAWVVCDGLFEIQVIADLNLTDAGKQKSNLIDEDLIIAWT